MGFILEILKIKNTRTKSSRISLLIYKTTANFVALLKSKCLILETHNNNNNKKRVNNIFLQKIKPEKLEEKKTHISHSRFKFRVN